MSSNIRTSEKLAADMESLGAVNLAALINAFAFDFLLADRLNEVFGTDGSPTVFSLPSNELDSFTEISKSNSLRFLYITDKRSPKITSIIINAESITELKRTLDVMGYDISAIPKTVYPDQDVKKTSFSQKLYQIRKISHQQFRI